METNAVVLPNLSFGWFENELLGAPLYCEEEGQFQAAIWEPLPSSVDRRITSDSATNVVRSWKAFGPPKSDFAYVQVTHCDMNGASKTGELVIHTTLARDVVAIARDIFIAKFPIQQERLIDYWDADDERSMTDNNSSALCVRQITGGGSVSQHALGRAWDINTLVNPYHNPLKRIIAPMKGAPYLDRLREVAGMIKEHDAVVRAFDARGWEWGGRWTTRVDYQHFEKRVSVPS
jgi:hypothetical protein